LSGGAGPQEAGTCTRRDERSVDGFELTFAVSVLAHHLLLWPISDRVEADEARNRFLDEADRRYAAIAKTGQTVPWSEMRRYLERRVAGETVDAPAARPLAD